MRVTAPDTEGPDPAGGRACVHKVRGGEIVARKDGAWYRGDDLLPMLWGAAAALAVLVAS